MGKGQVHSRARLTVRKKQNELDISNEDLVFYLQNLVYLIFTALTSYYEYKQDMFYVRIFKPMGMILLSIYLYFEFKLSYSFRVFVIQLAFFFALVGDILLTFKEEIVYFQIGGFAFFLTHTFYLINNIMNIIQVKKPFQFTILQPIFIIIPIVALFSVNAYLQPKLPVEITKFGYAYSTVLCLTIITTVIRYGKTTKVNYSVILVGFGMFLCSDSVLSLVRFDNLDSPVLILLYTVLYFMGQLFIYHSIVNHEKYMSSLEKQQKIQ